MKNDWQEKIESLYKSVINEEKNLSSSLNKALIFYIIIIIFLGGYTVYLNIRIKELATPTNLAIAINTQIKNSIPQFARSIKAQMKPGAKQMAYQSVDSVKSMIPKATEFAKNQIDFYVDEMANEVEKKHLVELQKIFEESIDHVAKNKDLIKDNKLGKALAFDLSSRLDKELGNIINNSFINSVDKFRTEVDSLRLKKITRMTKKEHAEKMFLVYWLYIVDNQEVGGGLFRDVITLANDTIKAVSESTTVK
jgi:hypothetical protein